MNIIVAQSDPVISFYADVHRETYIGTSAGFPILSVVLFVGEYKVREIDR